MKRLVVLLTVVSTLVACGGSGNEAASSFPDPTSIPTTSVAVRAGLPTEQDLAGLAPRPEDLSGFVREFQVDVAVAGEKFGPAAANTDVEEAAKVKVGYERDYALSPSGVEDPHPSLVTSAMIDILVFDSAEDASRYKVELATWIGYLNEEVGSTVADDLDGTTSLAWEGPGLDWKQDSGTILRRGALLVAVQFMENTERSWISPSTDIARMVLESAATRFPDSAEKSAAADVSPQILGGLAPLPGYLQTKAGVAGDYKVVSDVPMEDLAGDLPWLNGLAGGLERTYTMKVANDADPMTTHDGEMTIRVMLFDSETEAKTSVFDYRASLAGISDARRPFETSSRLDGDVAELYDYYTLSGERLPRIWEGSARRGRVWVWVQVRDRSNVGMAGNAMDVARRYLDSLLEMYPELVGLG